MDSDSGNLISMRSAWIYGEFQKQNAEQALIEQWLNESNQYSRLQKRIPLMGDAEIAEIFATYQLQYDSENVSENFSRHNTKELP